MTNKMPVVGKKYKHKEDFFKIKIKSIELLRNDYFVFPEEKISGWQLDEFLKNFEELPEDNLQEEKIKINFTQDGNKICATLADSIDLQSSPAGFGGDREEALVGLIYDILKQKEK